MNIIKKDQDYVMMQSIVNAYVINMLNDDKAKSITETYFKFVYSPSFREENKDRSSQIQCDYINYVQNKLNHNIYADLTNYVSKTAINRANKFSMIGKFVNQSVLKVLFNKEVEVNNIIK